MESNYSKTEFNLKPLYNIGKTKKQFGKIKHER